MNNQREIDDNESNCLDLIEETLELFERYGGDVREFSYLSLIFLGALILLILSNSAIADVYSVSALIKLA